MKDLPRTESFGPEFGENVDSTTTTSGTPTSVQSESSEKNPQESIARATSTENLLPKLNEKEQYQQNSRELIAVENIRQLWTTRQAAVSIEKFEEDFNKIENCPGDVKSVFSKKLSWWQEHKNMQNPDAGFEFLLHNKKLLLEIKNQQLLKQITASQKTPETTKNTL